MNYSDIKKGMKVDFCNVRSGKITEYDCTVTMEPWMMYGVWVCMINKQHECVSCAALSLPAERD